MKNKSIVTMIMGLAMLPLGGMAQTTRQEYKDIIDINLTPSVPRRQNGCFSDMGSWMGFTLPEAAKPVAGICGPYSIYYRNWYARSLVTVKDASLESSVYSPGEVNLIAKAHETKLVQSLQFVDARTALLTITNISRKPFTLTADSISSKMNLSLQDNVLSVINLNGERVMVSFPDIVKVALDGHNYVASVPFGVEKLAVGISIVEQETEASVQQVHVASLLANPMPALQANDARWNG